MSKSAHSELATTTHRAADVGQGFVALCGVAVLVVGVPIGLTAWVGWPLPAELPTLSEITDALRDTYIPDSFLIKTLALICWIVWIELMASLIVEAVAYARGRKAGPVPLAGGIQRSAARLVAGVALLASLVATKGLPVHDGDARWPLASGISHTVLLDLDDVRSTSPGPLADAPAPPAQPAPTYQVQRRDTLWDIAERHLGDPFRWPEIFQLNQGQPQADGRCLIDPDLIYPGWHLALPADAVGVVAPAPESPPPELPAATKYPDKVLPEPSGHPQVTPTAAGDGMVLIDDGAEDDAIVLVAEDLAHRRDEQDAPAYDPGAMVLLPEEERP